MRDPEPDPIRVALVVASLRILGGHGVQAQRMLDGWRGGTDVEAWIVPTNPIPAAPLDRLLRIKYARTVVTQLVYWPLLVRELRRAGVVHIFSASYSSFILSTLPAVIVARLLGKPIVLNYHSGEAPDHLQRSAIARRVIRRLVDLNVVPSPFLRDVFASFDVDALVIANTIDPRPFGFRPRDPLRPRLLCSRNFESNYNMPCVLRAFARIQAHHPDATLTLVGSGSLDASLRTLTAQLRLRNVTFAGRIPPSDMPGYYADADIYVQTPAIDNMPLSVLEAFASGLPVVSTRVGGIPSLLRDGIDGLLSPDDDDESIATHVLKLLDDPVYARGLAASAYETLTAYAWRTVGHDWLSAYRQTSRRAAGRLADPPRASAASNSR